MTATFCMWLPWEILYVRGVLPATLPHLMGRGTRVRLLALWSYLVYPVSAVCIWEGGSSLVSIVALLRGREEGCAPRFVMCISWAWVGFESDIGVMHCCSIPPPLLAGAWFCMHVPMCV